MSRSAATNYFVWVVAEPTLWRWLNEGRLVEVLRSIEDPDDREFMEAALAAILEAPFDPQGVVTHELKATSRHQGVRVAWLPLGYLLTFRPVVNGPPPLAGDHIVVTAVRHQDDR